MINNSKHFFFHLQLKKLQDKLRKCQQEVEGSREKYTAAVNDLNSYNPKYIEDMTEVLVYFIIEVALNLNKVLLNKIGILST